MLKFSTLSALLFIAVHTGFKADAQNKDSIAINPTGNPAVPNRKPGRALLQFGMAETLPWVFDRYLKKADYAYISVATAKRNLKPGSWTWDDDPFETNQFGHPYHGNYFFNAYRTNGYTFWQSVPAAFAGSYLWETFGEKQKPAPNDFINTGFGGVVLGEMTYRISNRLVSNHSRGFKRQLTEIAALLINPINGFNRIADGKWGKRPREAKDTDTTRVKAEFDLGVRRINSNTSNFLKNSKAGWYGHIRLIYGEPFSNYKTPFSNMYINAGFGKDDSSSVNIISAYGSLTGWKIFPNSRHNHIAILSANYDFIDNEAFFYGAQSVKLNILSSGSFGRKIHLTTNFGTGPILLAAVPDPYHPRGRNYDYTSGWGISGMGLINLNEKLFYTINYRGGWLLTINGNQSHYFLHTLSGEFRYRFLRDVSLCAETGYFTLEGKYNHFDNVNKRYPYIRLSLRYEL
ncbi:DUF3943 domain-containing protein [Mucilaginibacter sp. RS28]|uniref:DUF3943 domain-containing protein n=1 Tax=Mucilaginibacter straminoryzae TaxID=2932774 RepID=A0A9X1WZL2_9SPHI|nr:DUF3943 domain-containing protein [Mucilaginibacter straminoryzae]MCJ8208343.1 DUF3943 domain-containing protein [Mucilaginibacter straminoryzae]